MKPKFALDLSHEGINLLHRSKGGWSLVGSVELDDPEMGSHLADLRRRAAALESGGFTCKIIIPNSQVLYTTVEAPGPDDISREVQIRSGLDGLTPYPVGELVFDWRAAGERARVAVLARETMDEAETFAVEHRFNPVSFVARSAQGEFSGEPFFGKTRAATKILGPTERVEPDASPVPRKPPAMDTRPASGPSAAPAPGQAPRTETQAGPYSPGDLAPGDLAPGDLAPGDLAWQPPAEPEPAPGDRPTPATAVAPAPVPEPLHAPLQDVDPVDDPFAELDAIQAELSGDPDTMPAFRSRASRPQARPTRTDRAADQPTPPPLAPFPPTSDEADAMPSPSQPARKARASGKATAPDGAPASRPEAEQHPASDRGTAPRPGPTTAPDKAAAPAGGATGSHPTRPPAPGKEPSAQSPTKDDTPAQPGVAFSTRRRGTGTATTATPTTRGATSEPARGAPSDAPSQQPTPGPAQPAGRGPGREAASGDRRRADMADALSRPLPGAPTGTDSPQAPEKPGARGSLSDAMRGAAGGLRSFGQRRAPGKDEAKPADTSMAALMRGAGSSEARISPDQYDDEPDLLAPDVAAKDTARGSAPAGPAPAAEPTAGKPPASDAPAPKSERGTAAPDTAKTAPPAPPTAAVDEAPKPVAKPATKPAPAFKPEKPRAPAPAAKPDKPKGAFGEAEALTVFGARRTAEKRGGRKYLGLVLTLLLLLSMAAIAMWSSFFVDDGDPALFNPGEDTAAPEAPDAAPETAPDDSSTVTPIPDAEEAVPEDTPPEGTAPEATAPADSEAVLIPEVLTQEEAEARYAQTQIWQRAPEMLGEPFTPGLEMGAVGGPGTARSATADPSAIAEPDLPAAPGGTAERAAPLPPPPADTVFELDASGLVLPSPEGTVSPTGIIVYEGPPAVVPPTRPGTPALPEVTPEDATLDDAALEQAVEQAVEAAAALGTDVPSAAVVPDAPDLRPEPRPDDVPAPDTALPEATTPETADPEDGARLDGAPEDAPADPAAATADADALTDAPADAGIETAAADPTSIEAAVDAVAASFVDATELAVATSVKPTRRPADIDQIVNAAMARAAAAPPEPAAPAITTPAIPTSASVANQATTPNALNLREVNLLGISGPSNARRALVRMENGRYITVKVGDRLDGGRVTSITSDGLTYQKGSRNFTLQLLPLG